jgi:hypothetical protein
MFHRSVFSDSPLTAQSLLSLVSSAVSVQVVKHSSKVADGVAIQARKGHCAILFY